MIHGDDENCAARTECQEITFSAVRTMTLNGIEGTMPGMGVLSEDQIRMGFARRLKLLRQALGFKFAPAFAEATGINMDTYFKYEQGYRVPEPTRPEWQMIRNTTGATVDWLLYGDDNSLPTPLRRTLQEYERQQQDFKTRAKSP